MRCCLSNIYAKKRGIAEKLILTIRAIMIGQQIDVVAGDFNGTAGRCSNKDNISTIDEAFADCALPTPPGPTPLWGPGSIPNNWADVCGFLKPPGSDRYWKVRMHGAFSIPRKNLVLRPNDQSCHRETRLHLDFVDWRSTQSQHDEHDRRIFLKGRPTACSSAARPTEACLGSMMFHSRSLEHRPCTKPIHEHHVMA